LKKDQLKPIISSYEIITEQGYISQVEYLKLYPESVDRDAAMLELYKMEQQGLIYGNYAGKNPTFYLSDIVRH
jgi:hypothetical protein